MYVVTVNAVKMKEGLTTPTEVVENEDEWETSENKDNFIVSNDAYKG